MRAMGMMMRSPFVHGIGANLRNLVDCLILSISGNGGAMIIIMRVCGAFKRACLPSLSAG